SCDRAEPDLAALVRQRHLLWHGVHFPSLADGVKFPARRSDRRNFIININILYMIARLNFCSGTLDPRARLPGGRSETRPSRRAGVPRRPGDQEPRAWRIRRK